MELKITEQKQNPFLSRTEIKADLIYEGKTPSIQEIRKMLSLQLKKEESLVIVKNIFTKYGFNKAVVEANVYGQKEDLEKMELKYTLNRQTGKKSAEQAKEKSEEKPKEETKEKSSQKEEKK